MGISRRAVLAGAAAASAAASGMPAAALTGPSWDSIVVGAGVFGAWTAEQLRRAGQKVLLVDAWGPAHARASSGGESRMTRSDYGADDIYTRMAHASLGQWQALSARAGLPILNPCGVLFLFQNDEAYARDSIAVHRRLGLPLAQLDRAGLQARWPQIDIADIAFGLHETGFGALMARRAVQTLVEDFVRGGGEYRTAAIRPPGDGARLDTLTTMAGETLSARQFVFAAGPWLPKLLPGLLGPRIFPTRQEVFFFRTPAGNDSFGAARLPGWADWNGGDIVYGFPDLESRGFKIAQDAHGPAMDPDTGDRIVSAQGLEFARRYMARRFPAMADAPLSEARVCQYENSANGDFLIDRHPQWANCVMVGGGSGHGFKHGPEVGRMAAALLSDAAARPEPRFSLAAKGVVQARAVH
ncbi:FAD-dependent oxidoreductase [Sandarakinorhabdus sp.]|uniref:FAD-dependent oxidoreductase n=1 Tax=Sandarakinorhabdus sp. TaxID=1916663 RepID=UPI00286E3EE6|nr:FAD-dependent oxidoreductase [Sandarakinorhabdus sp.]